jgi:hypothetical protein
LVFTFYFLLFTQFNLNKFVNFFQTPKSFDRNPSIVVESDNGGGGDDSRTSFVDVENDQVETSSMFDYYILSWHNDQVETSSMFDYYIVS